MRQEIRNIYEINEHPNQEVCFEWMRNNWHDLGQHIVEEMILSLKALADYTGGKLDYSIGITPDRGEFVKITDYDPDLLKEISNTMDDCPLTGVCYDYAAIKGLKNGDLEEEVLTTLHNEGEYIYSDDGLLELAQANKYEFYATGQAI